MNDKQFFDTNVILYAFRHDDARGKVAETLLAAGGVLSVQVLNEFVAVARRKLDKSWEEVRRALHILRVFCPEPVPLTVETHERAMTSPSRNLNRSANSPCPWRSNDATCVATC